jgi:hypothetical protein
MASTTTRRSDSSDWTSTAVQLDRPTSLSNCSLTQTFPSGFPQIADVTFDVEWSGVLDRQHIRNEAENFEGDFLQTGSTIIWSSHNLSSGFSFQSEGPNPARVLNAAIGHVRNGVFFE